ncbi:hypothetical protein ACN08Y_06790 [Rothia sp. P5764]|uniref:hypothetical protein n=1 Tax=Rothia sp. P5764 TaxID=3402654 RepID=UPI003AD0980A
MISMITLLIGALIFVGLPLGEKYRRSHTVDKDCTLISAEVLNSRSGTGGLATSSTQLKVSTQDCGTVYIDYVVAPKRSYQDMADELNRYQGEVVTLIFPPFQLPAEGDYALGYGYRL